MCNAADALQSLGTGFSFIGKLQQANAQANALEHNAKVRELEARQNTELGFLREERVRRQSRRALGQQVVDLAKSGVDTATGTPLLLAFESGREAELDALSVATDTILKTDALNRDATIQHGRARDIRKSRAALAATEILSSAQRAWSALR